MQDTALHFAMAVIQPAQHNMVQDLLSSLKVITTGKTENQTSQIEQDMKKYLGKHFFSPYFKEVINKMNSLA